MKDFKNMRPPVRSRKYLPRTGLAIALSLLVAGCNMHREKSVKGWLVTDPTARHPITVGSLPVTLDVPVASKSHGLSKRQKYEVRAFLREYREKNEGLLSISAPSGGPNEVAVMHALGEIKREFNRAGINRREVQFETYTGVGAAEAPIKIAFSSYSASGPECGDWTEDLARDPQNKPYRNFGCAYQKNLAAMIANPRDLVEPRTMTPRDGQRRDVIHDKYVRGDSTVAERSQQENAQVSEVSGGGEN